jgi:hypothetical protein
VLLLCSLLLSQKVPFLLACFEASAAPRTENPNSNEKNALFALDTQITIIIMLSAQKIKRVTVREYYIRKLNVMQGGSLEIPQHIFIIRLRKDK